MTLIKEYEGSDGRTGRYLKNYNLDVLEKEIFRLTDELERVQKENNRLQSKLNSITDITEKEYLFISFGLSHIIEDISLDKYNNIDIETINKLRVKLQKLIK
jgi:hypothetical protein